MAIFSTPAPISVSLDLGVGSLEIIASDRADTVVEVNPADPARESDVAAAQQARVNYSNGVLTVKMQRNWRQYVSWNNTASVDVKIELPSGSRVRGEAAVGSGVIGATGVCGLVATGVLGECNFRVGAGDVRVDQAGPLQLRTGAGDVIVERAVERSEITTGSGAVHLLRADGPVVIKNSNGDIWVGEANAGLRVTSANGKIWVALARSDVEAKTANGSIQVDEVMHGTVHARTAMGRVEVGVRRGVAALLDLETSFGKVINDLDASGAPQPGEPSVEVRAHTGFGDIRLFRAGGSGTVESPSLRGAADLG